MKFSIISSIIFAAALAGCSLPDTPHPKNVTPFTYISNTPLTFVLLRDLGPYDGYFESSISLHIDTTDSQSENDASLYNHLGNSFFPEKPFSVFVNGKMLFDTSSFSRYSFSFSNNDSLDYTHPVVWQINASKGLPSFFDTLVPPQKAEILYPLPNATNVLPHKPFTIEYHVVGSDSVDFLFLISSVDTTSNFFYEQRVRSRNTGSFVVDETVIPFLPFPTSISISLAAITQKLHRVNGQTYLIRSGIIDNAGLRLTD